MTTRFAPLFVRASLMFASCSLLVTVGCGAGVNASIAGANLALTPSSTAIEPGDGIRLTPTGGAVDPSTCSYSSSNPTVLVSLSTGAFVGQVAGTTQITTTCADQVASALVTVQPKKVAALVITKGGTYSGTYTSIDPNVPAISVMTDEPVIIKNSVLTSRGDLIWISGIKAANVTVDNVTGTALDPQTIGRQRGRFVVGSNVDKISVTNCTMHGASFGLLVGGNTMTSVKFKFNTADDMEDRASNGLGGFLTDRPSLGHFVILARTVITGGAEVAWNQMINVIGGTSMEDTINLYDAQGTPSSPILVHDNWLEGASSAATPAYTGDGIITDGPGNDGGPPTAYVKISGNHIVHTAGGGIAIAAGHDILATGNRIVSCGKDSKGKWYAMPFTNGIDLFNIYNMPDYGNNVITKTYGGLVRPSVVLLPMASDIDVNAQPASLNSSMAGNLFTDPCLVKGKLNLAAEDAERTVWQNKLANNSIILGDQH